ncbi:hypothetical protein [Priestia aryabhattai]|uniref:Uncharacterized protein n=1 Tax=Priestia aryabhattai TaxID=412384 RepID=A0ABD7X3W2_PRIAR|nr:hypothetical protein [Priestia aryabhattai]WEA47271.1 hypothetical protein PWO00_28550 [Priestia aryabhattai]
MKKKKPSFNDLYITNLKELKAGYEAKGDVFSANKTNELIVAAEKRTKSKE